MNRYTSLPMPILIAQLAKRTAKKVQVVWDSVRVGKIVAVLVLYSFGGAYAFYWLEHQFTPADVDTSSGCLVNYNFWASLHYAATLYTTIGYGNVYCCSTPARALSCVYILFGTPLLLIVLDSIGKVFAYGAGKLWAFGDYLLGRLKKLLVKLRDVLRRCNRKKRGSNVKPMTVKPKNDSEADAKLADDRDGDKTGQEKHLPLSAGILFSIVWVLATAAYFQHIEGWEYGYSIYFLWITFTTVGLGDASPTKFEYTIINFLLLIIGLSSVSMCINILQTKIENMIKRIQANIEKQYRDLLEKQTIDPETGEVVMPSLEDLPPPPKKGFFSNILQRSEDEILKKFMSKKEEEQLQQLVTKRAEMADKAVQVEFKIYQPHTTPSLQERPDWKF